MVLETRNYLYPVIVEPPASYIADYIKHEAHECCSPQHTHRDQDVMQATESLNITYVNSAHFKANIKDQFHVPPRTT